MEFKAEEDKIVLSLKAIKTKENVDEEMKGECILVEEPTIVQQPMAFPNVPYLEPVVNCPRSLSPTTPPFKPSVNVGPT